MRADRPSVYKMVSVFATAQTWLRAFRLSPSRCLHRLPLSLTLPPFPPSLLPSQSVPGVTVLIPVVPRTPRWHLSPRTPLFQPLTPAPSRTGAPSPMSAALPAPLLAPAAVPRAQGHSQRPVPVSSRLSPPAQSSPSPAPCASPWREPSLAPTPPLLHSLPRTWSAPALHSVAQHPGVPYTPPRCLWFASRSPSHRKSRRAK